MGRIENTAIERLPDDGNPFGSSGGRELSAPAEVAMSRAAQEVQAAMVIAKKFPRDEQAAYARIMNACKRITLAESAVYSYPKGGTDVEGPSIRLAEVLAQSWGNVDFGVIELEQRDGESVVMSYCWDLETNTRQAKVFSVRHERHSKKGTKELTDPRDIYETVANQGARRLRACILGIIPGDVVEAAVNQCNKTVMGKNETPIADRIRSMLSAFDEMSVTQLMIEKAMMKGASALTERDLLRLRKIYSSLRDGMANVDQFFDLAAVASDLNAKAANGSVPQQSAPISDSPTKSPADAKLESDVAARKADQQPPKEESQIPPEDQGQGDDNQAAASDYSEITTWAAFVSAMESRAQRDGISSEQCGKTLGLIQTRKGWRGNSEKKADPVFMQTMLIGVDAKMFDWETAWVKEDKKS